MTVFWHAVPWEEASSLAFLRRAARAPRFLWETEDFSLAAFGLLWQRTARGPQRFRHLQQAADELFRGMQPLPETAAPPWVHPYLLSGFAFAPEGKPAGIWEGFPAGGLYLPRYTLLRREGRAWLVAALPAEDTAPEVAAERLREALWDLPAPQNRPSRPPGLPRLEDLTPRPAWDAAVRRAVESIREGGLRKVVLARIRRLRASRPFDPLLALDRLRTRYPRCYRFLYQPQAEGAAFFGATPELLAAVREGEIRTMALAGSTRRGATLEEDERLGAALLRSGKDRHEHALVVEAIREALAPRVRTLEVPAGPRLKRLSNIQHLHTPIRGGLLPGVSPLGIVEALHPTPAVGGLPRSAALEFIARHEAQPRGWYAAPVGWLSPGGEAAFAVALRCALVRGREAHLFAGAGIVSASDPAAEWRETALKFRPVQQALWE